MEVVKRPEGAGLALGIFFLVSALAGDHTAWSRPDAVTLQERTIEHSNTTVPGNRPITIGQSPSGREKVKG